MLTRGNSKLGNLIWGWSIPALVTCVAFSKVCKEICYALRGHFRTGTVKEAHNRNLELAKSSDFAPVMSRFIRRQSIMIVRIHVSGDFFTRTYIRRWLKVIRSNPHVIFFAFTRSWNDPDLLSLLVEMGREPNVQMWFSWDHSMPAPPRRKGIRNCYLSTSDSDWPNRKVDLIFREQQDTVVKKDPKGNPVCPYDNGVTNTTCSKCGICWNPEGQIRRPSLLQLQATA